LDLDKLEFHYNAIKILIKSVFIIIDLPLVTNILYKEIFSENLIFLQQNRSLLTKIETEINLMQKFSSFEIELKWLF
jgi:hypothetical protein